VSAQIVFSNCCFIQGGNGVNLHDHEATVDLLLQDDEIGYIQKGQARRQPTLSSIKNWSKTRYFVFFT
jgi:hypothetical protein